LSFYEDKTEHLNQALTFLQEALEIQQKIGDQARAWMTLSNIGWVYELQGKSPDALKVYQAAIALLEKIIASVGGVEEFKVSLGAQAVMTYQRAILLLMCMGQSEQAFEFSERARARVLLDQLGNIRLRARRKGDESLLQQEHAVRLELIELDRRLKEQLAKPEAQQDRELLQLVKKQQKQKHNEYEDLLVKIKLSNPEYASLVRVEPLTLKDVQQQLNSETTLLSYFVTPDKTLAFVITRNSFKSIELPISAEALKIAVTRSHDPGRPSDPPPKALKDLYTELIMPVKQCLTTPIIGIIPHGVLHYLPFAALTDGQRYFSDEYTLFSLSSTSVLKFLKSKPKASDSSVLAMANGQAAGLPPLHYVEQEVKALARFYKTHLLIGKEATESALKARAENCAILHLAAHGELNTISPLFSRIMLSSDQENDGALEVHEVYDLNLQQTDLVVLSACETQLGERSQGDDIVGLTRAFMYAGTPSVIASLWNVDDQATADFMQVFYSLGMQGYYNIQSFLLGNSPDSGLLWFLYLNRLIAQLPTLPAASRGRFLCNPPDSLCFPGIAFYSNPICAKMVCSFVVACWRSSSASCTNTKASSSGRTSSPPFCAT
jgi:CHAT domain-containing protein